MAYKYPLSIQLTLPENHEHDRDFREVLQTLQTYGFSGVELNIVRPEGIDPQQLERFLNGFGLRMTMFASGASAKAEGLSLCAPEEEVVEKSIARCGEFIRFAARFGAGVIVGFLKGGAAVDRQAARRRFAGSLERIAPLALQARVPVLIEATNRYESAVANSLEDTCALIACFSGNRYLRVLPDTYHMNIEEADPFAALRRHHSLYDSIHISDNNRFFPGLGAIRFEELFQFLSDTNYSGSIAIEGNIRDDLLSDLRKSVSYLQPMIRG